MSFLKNASTIWRDAETLGVPSSGVHEPIKSEIRQWGGEVEAALSAGALNGGLIYTSRAALYADLDHDENASAWVTGDATANYNGIYQKSGASGTGAWTRIDDLPYQVISLTNSNVDPNSIVATSARALPSTPLSAIFLLDILADNTSVVALKVNSEVNRSVRTSQGEHVPPGTLKAGTVVALFSTGTQYWLVGDAAEAVAAAASAAASETAAAGSASAASTSATNAATSATAAAGSASAASTSATNAATSATDAANSASAASTSATNAATSATAAAGSASAASTSATNAATSETAAAGSASAASTSATNAATSATGAANSASAANTSATSAATSATGAANSASAASTSETNAAASASDASDFADAAEISAGEAAASAALAATGDPTTLAYRFTSRAALKAAATNDIKFAFLDESGADRFLRWDPTIPIATHQADAREGAFIAPNASSDGAWVVAHNGFLLTKWFRDDPTGVLDSKPAFQGAIDVAAVMGIRYVRALAGEYRMSSAFSIKSGVVLRGDGPQSVLVQFDTYLCTGPNDLEDAGVVGFTLRNGISAGGNAWNAAFSLKSHQRCRFGHLVFENSYAKNTLMERFCDAADTINMIDNDYGPWTYDTCVAVDLVGGLEGDGGLGHHYYARQSIAELVVNGQFASGYNGWGATAAVDVTVDGGEVTLTSNTGANASKWIVQEVPVVSGVPHTFHYDFVDESPYAQVRLGNAEAGQEYAIVFSPGGADIAFTPTQGSVFVTLLLSNTAGIGDSATFGNISIRQAGVVTGIAWPEALPSSAVVFVENAKRQLNQLTLNTDYTLSYPSGNLVVTLSAGKAVDSTRVHVWPAETISSGRLPASNNRWHKIVGKGVTGVARQCYRWVDAEVYDFDRHLAADDGVKLIRFNCGLDRGGQAGDYMDFRNVILSKTNGVTDISTCRGLDFGPGSLNITGSVSMDFNWVSGGVNYAMDVRDRKRVVLSGTITTDGSNVIIGEGTKFTEELTHVGDTKDVIEYQNSNGDWIAKAIASIDSDTQLTLTGNAVGGAGLPVRRVSITAGAGADILFSSRGDGNSVSESRQGGRMAVNRLFDDVDAPTTLRQKLTAVVGIDNANGPVVDPDGGLHLPSYTEAELTDIGHAVNTQYKAAGKTVWDTSNEISVTAVGSAAGAVWKGEGTTHTPI